MVFMLFFLCFVLLSLPTYRILNVGQICLFIISSVVILVYYFRRTSLGKKLTIKFPIYLISIIVASVSYNLKAEKGWIGYIPLVQLLIALIFSIYVLLVSKRKKISAIRAASHKDGRLVFVFASIAIVFMALAMAGWINFLSVDLFYKRGNSQLIDGKIDEAILNFTKAIDKKPNLYSIYPKLLNILYRKGQYDKIINICKKNISYLRMTFGYYDVFCFYLGSSYFKESKLKEALIYYDKLISVAKGGSLERDFGTWEEFNFYSGYCYSRFEKFEEALKEYQKILTLDPENILAKFKIAEAYYFLGKAKDALEIFEQLIESGFSYRDIFFYIGDIYTRERLFDKAVVMFERYVTDSERDNDWDAYFKGHVYIGNIYLTLSMKEQTVNTYKKLLSLKVKGRRAQGYYLLGNAYRYFQMEREAEEAYLKAMKVDWYNKRGYYVQAARGVGYIYEAKQNWEGAMRLYKSILARGSKEAFCYIGDLYLRRQMWDEADKAYDIAYGYKSLGMPYLLAQPYQELLKEYEKQQRWDKVSAISEKLMDIGPGWLTGGKDEWIKICLKFAELCESRGKQEKASKVYQRILYLYPEDKEASEAWKGISSRNVQQ